MSQESQEMLKILQNLENRTNGVTTSGHTLDTQSAHQVGDGNVSPDAVEMYNILNKLNEVQDATDTVATRMVTESVDTIPSQKQHSVGVDRFNVVLNEQNVSGFKKTYYTVAENGTPVHTDLALFESAMAIIKNKLFKDDPAKTNAILDSDHNYATALEEAAGLKRKMKTLTESISVDVTAAKHNMATDRMKKAKSTIKKLL